MSRYDPLFTSILEAVASDEQLGDVFSDAQPGWLAWDLPPVPNQDDGLPGYPCIRVQLTDSRNTRQGEYNAIISLYLVNDQSDEATDFYLACADALEAGLNRSRNIINSGYLNRPEPQNRLFRALYPVVFVAGA